MSISKMLQNDLTQLEQRYEKKVQVVLKVANHTPTDKNMRIYENCYNALIQLRRLRAVFERTFR